LASVIETWRSLLFLTSYFQIVTITNMMSFPRIVLTGMVALLVAASNGSSQTDMKGMKFGGVDLNEFFSGISNGKDVITRADVNPRSQHLFDKMSKRLGITNGQISRDQFRHYMMDKSQQLRERGDGPPGSSASAEKKFRQLDTKGDGVLNFDTMPADLRDELTMWDSKGNGLIDLDQFKAFMDAKTKQRLVDDQRSANAKFSPPTNGRSTPTPARDDKRKPVIYRYDNLPKDLPGWFKELDTNHDGQIALYEWKASGKSLDEFVRMDRNKDGFLTVDEVLFYEAQKKKNQATSAAAKVAARPTRTSGARTTTTIDPGSPPGRRSTQTQVP
jgi:Ca2+-binding EF-hand superfamily protein